MSDDAVYVFLLLLSLPLGLIVRRLQSSFSKQLVCFIAGISIAILVSRNDIFHSLFICLFTYFVISSNITIIRRNANILVFSGSFIYLLFFRGGHLLNTIPLPRPHSNAIQLIMTLKMITLAFEFCDIKVGHNSDIRLFDLLSYAYCPFGLLTGPVYSFSVFKAMLGNSNSVNEQIMSPLLQRLKLCCLFICSYIIISHFFPISVLRSSFYDSSVANDNVLYFLHRASHAFVSLVQIRHRFIIAWLLAESGCICAVLGVSDVEQSNCNSNSRFALIKNIDVMGIEFPSSPSGMLRSWNQSVQTWLATIVYRRFPVRSYRTIAVYAVSAYWHGLHPGCWIIVILFIVCYYVTFLSAPLFTHCESVWRTRQLPYENLGFMVIFYRGLQAVLSLIAIHYLVLGFVLLSVEDTFRVLWSLYFYGHVSCILLILCANFLPLRSKNSK